MDPYRSMVLWFVISCPQDTRMRGTRPPARRVLSLSSSRLFRDGGSPRREASGGRGRRLILLPPCLSSSRLADTDVRYGQGHGRGHGQPTCCEKRKLYKTKVASRLRGTPAVPWKTRAVITSMGGHATLTDPFSVPRPVYRWKSPATPDTLPQSSRVHGTAAGAWRQWRRAQAFWTDAPPTGWLLSGSQPTGPAWCTMHGA